MSFLSMIFVFNAVVILKGSPENFTSEKVCMRKNHHKHHHPCAWVRQQPQSQIKCSSPNDLCSKFWRIKEWVELCENSQCINCRSFQKEEAFWHHFTAFREFILLENVFWHLYHIKVRLGSGLYADCIIGSLWGRLSVVYWWTLLHQCDPFLGFSFWN